MVPAVTTLTDRGRLEQRCATARCRCCGRQGLVGLLDFGAMCPSDRLLTEAMLREQEPRFPLALAICPDCSLVQTLETLPPEMLFGENYVYYSSFCETLVAHARENARGLIHSRGLGPEHLVVEIASNDGYQLRNFVEAGVPVLGIDPAPGQARAANEAGVPTLQAFFTRDLAEDLVRQGRHADVVIATNVLPHVGDTNGFVEGIAHLLKSTGVAVVEVPYVRDLVRQCAFDTIYHEHHCYFSATALDHLFRRHGLYLNDVEEVTVHGGTLRVYVEHHAEHREPPSPRVTRILEREQAEGLTRPEYFTSFAERVEQLRRTLRGLLGDLHAAGRRLAGYGAAAKGTILLNSLGLEPGMIEFVADRNVHKQGRYIPGLRVPIVSPQALCERMPDYTLVLPWNIKDEIIQQQTTYRQRGGRFIIPVPEVVVV